MKKREKFSNLSDKEKIFKINKILGNTYFIVFIGIIIYIITLFAINYILNIFNCLISLDQFMENNNFFSIFAISNIFCFSNVEKYSFVYIFHLILNIVFFVKLFINNKVAYMSFNDKQKGSRRWTTEDEIKEQFIAVPENPYDEYGNLNEYEGDSGFPIAHIDDMLYLNTSVLHALNIGATGAGKGQCFVLPTIDTLSRVKEEQNGRKKIKPSIIVPDPKLENYAYTVDELDKRGYEPKILNLINFSNSIGYNPLKIVTDYYMSGDIEKAEEQAKVVAFSMYGNDKEKTSDPYWTEQAEAYCTALIMAHTEDCCKSGNPKQNNMYSLTQAHNYLNSKTVEINDELFNYLDIYFEQREDTSIAKSIYLANFKNTPSKTKQTIFSTVAKELQIFLSSSIAKMTSDSTINLEDFGFGEKPIALFIGFDESNGANHKIMSMFIGQLYTQLVRYAISHNKDGMCERPVKFIYDEFGNTPPINDIKGKVTLARGRNIQFIFIIQSYSQFDELYGKDIGSVIKENISTQIYMLTNGFDTAKYFSELIGNYTYDEPTRSGALLSNNKTITEGSSMEKPLLNPNELMELLEGETVVFRTSPRKTLKGEDAKPYPIQNRDKNRFKYAYEYLNNCFIKKDYIDIAKKNNFENTKLEDIKFNAFDYVTSMVNIMKIINEDPLNNFIIDIFKAEENPYFKEYKKLDFELENLIRETSFQRVHVFGEDNNNTLSQNVLDDIKEKTLELEQKKKMMDQYESSIKRFDYKKYNTRYIFYKLMKRYNMKFKDFINQISVLSNDFDMQSFIEEQEEKLKERNINTHNKSDLLKEFKDTNVNIKNTFKEDLYITLSEILHLEKEVLIKNRYCLEYFIFESGLIKDISESDYALVKDLVCEIENTNKNNLNKISAITGIEIFELEENIENLEVFFKNIGVFDDLEAEDELTLRSLMMNI